MQKYHDQGVGRSRLPLQVGVGLGRKEFHNVVAGIGVKQQGIFEIRRELFRGTLIRKLGHSLVFSQWQQEIADSPKWPKGRPEKESHPAKHRSIYEALKERRATGSSKTIGAVSVGVDLSWYRQRDRRPNKRMQSRSNGKKQARQRSTDALTKYLRPNQQTVTLLAAPPHTVQISRQKTNELFISFHFIPLHSVNYSTVRTWAIVTCWQFVCERL
jgi:hypothetical protein